MMELEHVRLAAALVHAVSDAALSITYADGTVLSRVVRPRRRPRPVLAPFARRCRDRVARRSMDRPGGVDRGSPARSSPVGGGVVPQARRAGSRVPVRDHAVPVRGATGPRRVRGADPVRPHRRVGEVRCCPRRVSRCRTCPGERPRVSRGRRRARPGGLPRRGARLDGSRPMSDPHAEGGPAIAGDVASFPRDAEYARTLVASQRRGQLATLTADGFPFGSVVSYVEDALGTAGRVHLGAGRAHDQRHPRPAGEPARRDARAGRATIRSPRHASRCVGTLVPFDGTAPADVRDQLPRRSPRSGVLRRVPGLLVVAPRAVGGPLRGRVRAHELGGCRRVRQLEPGSDRAVCRGDPHPPRRGSRRRAARVRQGVRRADRRDVGAHGGCRSLRRDAVGQRHRAADGRRGSRSTSRR